MIYLLITNFFSLNMVSFLIIVFKNVQILGFIKFIKNYHAYCITFKQEHGFSIKLLYVFLLSITLEILIFKIEQCVHLFKCKIYYYFCIKKRALNIVVLYQKHT